MPPDGDPVGVPSLVAGFARLVYYRCEVLGVFAHTGPTPVLDALMSPKEPKTGPDGTMSWTVDVLNSATGDDFVLGVKELVLPDGSRRPYSLWLSGVYPRVLDGLCKSLSFDMRVIDPAWVGAKLRQIADYSEPRGDFFAWEPGRHRQQLYPSTVAYIATLLLHRYTMLGTLNVEGEPVAPMGLVQVTGDKVVPIARAAGAHKVMAGRRCPDCGTYALIRKDGCDFCTACGSTGTCG
jgi:ribonucleoside-diphosphate reductase alpha chain